MELVDPASFPDFQSAESLYAPDAHDWEEGGCKGFHRAHHLCTQQPYVAYPCDYVRQNFYRYRENMTLFIAQNRRDPVELQLPRDVLVYIVACGHWDALTRPARRYQYRSEDYSDSQLHTLPIHLIVTWFSKAIVKTPHRTEISELAKCDPALLHRVNNDIYLSTFALQSDGGYYIKF
jgi:hypothetical protein